MNIRFAEDMKRVRVNSQPSAMNLFVALVLHPTVQDYILMFLAGIIVGLALLSSM